MFTRARLVLAGWFTLALVVTLVAIGAVAYVSIRRDIDREIDGSLESALVSVRQPNPRPGAGRGPYDDYPEHYRIPPDVPSDVFVVYTDYGGEVLANPRRVDVDTVNFGELCDEATAGALIANTPGDGESYRFLTAQGQRSGEWVHVGRSLEARDRQLRTLSTVFAVGGAGGVVAAAAGGLWLAGLALRPIRASFERQRQFVSDASHELRTPLAVMRANGELLQRHPDQTIERNMDQVDAITAEAEAMTKLVEDLLTLARADEGEANLAKEPVPLGVVIEELGRDMEALAAARGLALRVDAEPVEVIGDRHRLRQLAAILVENAIKYTPAGGSVSVRAVRAGRSVEVTVSDTGPGIPLEEQGRIFDRFVRADSARTRSAGGTGLGLAIAKWIAEAHSGKIAVESVAGSGSKFTVRLPAAD